jgi:hypothetical protein
MFRYEGSFVKGKYEGQGKITYQDGSSYTGALVRGWSALP